MGKRSQLPKKNGKEIATSQKEWERDHLFHIPLAASYLINCFVFFALAFCGFEPGFSVDGT